jgi:hypothetical protein
LIDEKWNKNDEKEEEDDDKQNDYVDETESEEDESEEPDEKTWPVFKFNKVKEFFFTFYLFFNLIFKCVEFSSPLQACPSTLQRIKTK